MTNNGNHDDSQFRVQHVAVLIETETSWGGRVIRGIAHFAEKHTHWHLLIDPRDHEQRSAVPDGWQGDGPGDDHAWTSQPFSAGQHQMAH